MNNELNEIVLSVLEKQDKPVDRRDLQIMCDAPETEEFNNALSYLKAKGRIIIERKKVGLPSTMGYLPATILRCAKGFCFAEPHEGLTEDLFIRASASKGAMPGDIVMLKNITAGEKGFSADVSEILSKGNRVITGKVDRPESKFGKAFLVPDEGFSYPIKIVKGGELKSKRGDKVKASVYYDQKEKNVYARVIKVYGRSNSAKICSDAIIDSYGIPTKFPVPVKHEAAIKAAHGQIDLAVDYLYNGIPEGTNDNLPLMEGEGEEGGEEGGDEDPLKKTASIAKILCQNDPSKLTNLMQNIQQNDPDLFALINEREEEFKNLLEQPVTEADIRNLRSFQQEMGKRLWKRNLVKVSLDLTSQQFRCALAEVVSPSF